MRLCVCVRKKCREWENGFRILLLKFKSTFVSWCVGSHETYCSLYDLFFYSIPATPFQQLQLNGTQVSCVNIIS